MIQLFLNLLEKWKSSVCTLYYSGQTIQLLFLLFQFLRPTSAIKLLDFCTLLYSKISVSILLYHKIDIKLTRQLRHFKQQKNKSQKVIIFCF